MIRQRFGIVLVCCAAWTGQARAVDFENDVATILIKRCMECHNPREAAGGLVLADQESALKGGDSGEVIAPRDAANSELLRRIASTDDDRMPPDVKGQPRPLPDAERQALRDWIEKGAAWPKGRKLSLFERTTDIRGGLDWWSLQPIAEQQQPVLDGAANPIDAFILHRLQEKRWRPAPIADRRTLVRRLYIDMFGVPPSYHQIQSFLQDERPDAWERLVDRVLASPRFGQRWSRYWLDLVRYADTSGYERDQTKPFAWRYRDWVIEALNDDTPYNTFVAQQLAGDQGQDRSRQSLIGTGFLRLGTWNDEPNDPQDYKYERLEDLVHVTSTAFMGLTVKCARCHDHKFDPIPQTDYYRMASMFWPGPIEPRDRKLLGGPSDKELGAAEVLAWTDVTDKPTDFFLLKNGNRHQPREKIEPASLSFLPKLQSSFETRNRRQQMAQWLTDERNPLPARVIANRLWLHHFGDGLVRTPNNFGFTGEKPTHPALLDWLAAEIVRNEWRLKPIHRLILTSSVYQQASLHPQQREYAEQDSGNALRWRGNRRRLDAEALRDALLFVSGELDERHGGEGFRPSISPEATEGLSRKASAWQASSELEQKRRSIYMFAQRSLLPPIMTAFDLCDSTAPCGHRNATTVAPQALAMMNHAFPHQRSSALARRVLAASADTRQRIQAAWRLALGRTAANDEVDAAQRYLDAQRPRFEAPQEADPASAESWKSIRKLRVTDGLTLHLSADHGVEKDDAGRVVAWRNLRGNRHVARQSNPAQRPFWVARNESGRAALRFDGQARFLQLDIPAKPESEAAKPILTNPDCTLFAVASDRAKPGHREILSNWNGSAGNSTSSIFLGLTGDRSVRFTDHFAPAGEIREGRDVFLLTAINGAGAARVYQNANLLAERASPLGSRRIDTAWVIGQQGNIGGEYWRGDIAEILVFDRALHDKERKDVWGYLLNKYQLSTDEANANRPTQLSPELLTWTSLCQVLLNSNEFLYVD